MSREEILLDEDAPYCADCGEPAGTMYKQGYDVWLACKGDPICTKCADVRFANEIRQASLARGLRVGV